MTPSASLHLLKLFVGLATLPELAEFQQAKLEAAEADGDPPDLARGSQPYGMPATVAGKLTKLGLL